GSGLARDPLRRVDPLSPEREPGRDRGKMIAVDEVRLGKSLPEELAHDRRARHPTRQIDDVRRASGHANDFPDETNEVCEQSLAADREIRAARIRLEAVLEIRQIDVRARRRRELDLRVLGAAHDTASTK